MRLIPSMLFVLLVSARAGAAPPLNYCAAVAPHQYTLSELEASLLEQISRTSNQLDLAFELFENLRPGLSHEQAFRLFWLTVRHWLEVKQALCSCQPTVAARPGCEQLQAEVARSCEIEPQRLHGINVRCLTKGR